MSVLFRRLPEPLLRKNSTDIFAHDVISGLSAQPKKLLPKYFYDEVGSLLFEDITRLPEYYPTRTELGILNDNAPAIASLIPRGAALIEFGAGSALKATILLNAAPQIAAYVPVDISAEFLGHEARKLARDIPRVSVHPVAADFTTPFALPAAIRSRATSGWSSLAAVWPTPSLTATVSTSGRTACTSSTTARSPDTKTSGTPKWPASAAFKPHSPTSCPFRRTRFRIEV